MEYDEQISNIILFSFMWEQNACIFSGIHCFVLHLSLKTVYHSQSMLRELAPANYSFNFLHKIQQTHAKRFDWPKYDDIDRVHSTCMFFGPVHLKGNGPFEVIDLQRN